MFTLLKERRLRWLDHVWRMKDGRLPKNILYGKLVDGSRAIGRTLHRFKDVCKRDLKTCGIDVVNWEVFCTDRNEWRTAVIEGALNSEILRDEKWAET